MTRTHVLIDLDGTISDSSLGIARSLQHAFATCGYEPPSDDAVRSIIGPPFEVTFPMLGVPVADMAPVVAAYRERYNDVGLFENEIYDGIAEMLVDLQEVGMTLALATAKPEAVARRITSHFGVDRHFTFEAGASTDIGADRRSKDQVITYALVELGIEAGAHVVMVGDRDHDVEGAIANDIDCIGVTWGFGSHAELDGAGAHTIVNTPAEVVAAVQGTYRSTQS
jgi:phosphoglycolate phosphatase